MEKSTDDFCYQMSNLKEKVSGLFSTATDVIESKVK